jgi:hypothetical protein
MVRPHTSRSGPFNGGPVIPHVDVHNVFYGQSWPGYDKYGFQRGALNQFQSDITQSPYLAIPSTPETVIRPTCPGTSSNGELLAGSRLVE